MCGSITAEQPAAAARAGPILTSFIKSNCEREVRKGNEKRALIPTNKKTVIHDVVMNSSIKAPHLYHT